MLKNIMEMLVEQKLESMWRTSDYCKCDKCREDILAQTLNHLPTHYVSTDVGSLFARAGMLTVDHDFDLVREIAKAITLVGLHPHH